MKFRFFSVSGLIAVLLFGGCSSLPVLMEPETIPVCVSTYEAQEFDRFSDVVVDLDLSDCVEGAMLVSKGVFGGVTVEAAYPVRLAVGREFNRVIEDNFQSVSTNDIPVDIVVHVTTMRMLLVRTQYTYTSDLSLTIRVDSVDSKGGPPIFRKTYRAKASGSADEDDEIPQCFYESMQSIALDFVTDLTDNRRVVKHLENCITKKGAK